MELKFGFTLLQEVNTFIYSLINMCDFKHLISALNPDGSFVGTYKHREYASVSQNAHLNSTSPRFPKLRAYQSPLLGIWFPSNTYVCVHLVVLCPAAISYVEAAQLKGKQRTRSGSIQFIKILLRDQICVASGEEEDHLFLCFTFNLFFLKTTRLWDWQEWTTTLMFRVGRLGHHISILSVIQK